MGFGERAKYGDLISIVVDRDKASLSFELNGKDLGIAFFLEDCDQLYFAVSLFGDGSGFSLLP